jgi:hypothetical protein
MFVELVWGLKSRRKSSGTALAQPQPLEACGTKRKALGMLLGLSGGLLSYQTIALEHHSKWLISRHPSGGPTQTAVVAIWAGHRTRREVCFCRP